MPKEKKKFLNRHYEMMHRRGLTPKNYTLVKETYAALWLRDKRDGTIKIINKYN